MLSPFYIKLTTKLTVTDQDKAAVINFIKAFVDKNKAEDITATENSVAFKTSFFGWSWDTFSQLDKGVFTLNKNELTFKFYFIRTYIFFAIFLSMVAYQTRDIKVCIFFFLALFIGNWVTASVRYKTLLEKLTVEINNNKLSADT